MSSPLAGKRSLTIKQALFHIQTEDWGPTGFSITFVKGSGKSIGQIRTVDHCRYGATDSHLASKYTSNRAKAAEKYTPKQLFKDNYTLPLVNLDNDSLFTPIISHITHLEGIPIHHQ